jgi:hypothetical protein
MRSASESRSYKSSSQGWADPDSNLIHLEKFLVTVAQIGTEMLYRQVIYFSFPIFILIMFR